MNDCENDKALTVTEANGLIHDSIERSFNDVAIEGEVSGFRPSSTGHWYFTLKDTEASIDSAVFRASQRDMSTPKNGDLVTCRGGVSYYRKTGKVTYVIREMHKKGAGALIELIEKRKEYFRSKGYFDEDKKKPIPKEITRLGVVTSPTGAALRDILNVTRRRAPSLDIIVFPCAVQGEGASESIAKRICQASSFGACDILIVGRGGGSAEDLSCFSDPIVLEAIHRCTIPVISAVGHEIDWPISDFVADKRAPTPSAAAELATETIFRRRERLEKVVGDTLSSMKDIVNAYDRRISSCLSSMAMMEQRVLRYQGRIPSTDDLRRLLVLRASHASERLAWAEEDAVATLRRRVDDAVRRVNKTLGEMTALMETRIDGHRRILERMTDRLGILVGKRVDDAFLALSGIIRETEALSPLAILDRGYSVTYRRSDKRIVRGPDDVRKGDELVTRLREGWVLSGVKEIAN